jgi:hypothetical protein
MASSAVWGLPGAVAGAEVSGALCGWFVWRVSLGEVVGGVEDVCKGFG